MDNKLNENAFDMAAVLALFNDTTGRQLEEALNNGLDMRTKLKRTHFYSLLGFAVETENEAAVRVLMARGASVNAWGKWCHNTVGKVCDVNTPLMLAADKLNLPIVDMLLQEKTIEINKVSDLKGYTALHYAAGAARGKAHGKKMSPLRRVLVERLIAQGADVNMGGSCSNENRLYRADLYQGFTDTLNFYRANLSTPLMAYLETGESALEVAECFLKAPNADYSLRDRYNNTILHYAVAYNEAEMVDRLCAVKDVDIYAKNQHGNTPLMIGLSNGSCEAVQTLMNNTPPQKLQILLNMRNCWGQTPLSLVCYDRKAAKFSFPEVEREADLTAEERQAFAAALVQAGADVNIRVNAPFLPKGEHLYDCTSKPLLSALIEKEDYALAKEVMQGNVDLSLSDENKVTVAEVINHNPKALQLYQSVKTVPEKIKAAHHQPPLPAQNKNDGRELS